MIKEMDIRCHLYGERFSPTKVEQLTGISLENKIEVGDILSNGRNKGTLSSDTFCCRPAFQNIFARIFLIPRSVYFLSQLDSNK
ncbi:hypothetical protein [Chengkuizengella axinellae]|uniref:Uncharacterized protein n=1 Tax=Chengkuizengella axinellae TaxID=3064388 RepID=A0ABT9J6L0_9BACL|nr:hypothetical protein [Chengkuizengella sp. 2205SS18-9]MDP5277224.1 hypothetical protein [Chengkuizengella sp. 2205SS18-9]